MYRNPQCHIQAHHDSEALYKKALDEADALQAAIKELGATLTAKIIHTYDDPRLMSSKMIEADKYISEGLTELKSTRSKMASLRYMLGVCEQ